SRAAPSANNASVRPFAQVPDAVAPSTASFWAQPSHGAPPAVTAVRSSSMLAYAALFSLTTIGSSVASAVGVAVAAETVALAVGTASSSAGAVQAAVVSVSAIAAAAMKMVRRAMVASRFGTGDDNPRSTA